MELKNEMPKIHDWDGAKKTYVEGIINKDGNLVYPTLEETAKRHGISNSTMRKKSMADGWASERDIFRTRLERKHQENRLELLAGKASEFDAGIFRAAEIGLAHIKMHFVKANEAMAKAPEGQKNPLSTTALNTLSKALERFQRVGRLALGEPTEITLPSDGSTGNTFNILSSMSIEELRQLANLDGNESKDDSN